MSDPRRQEEPTMEEILASIRRIIAEDGAAGVPVSAPGIEQDILELTDKVESDGSVVSIAALRPALRPEPRMEPRYEAPIDVAPITVAPLEAKYEQPKHEQRVEPAKAEPKVEAEPENGRLISETAASASVAALAELAKELPKRPAPVQPPNAALEDTTRELMQPLLKTWLDANLPSIVERVVREEIARLSREVRGN